MTSITINKVSLEDLETLQHIGKETFFETFSENNSEEDMQRYLEESFSTEKLTSEINNPDSLFYIAREEKNVVGYLKLNFGKAQTELQDDSSVEIERIYVKSNYFGKKVGQILYEKALEIAQDQQKSYIWLAVWEKNPRAINFYQKNGFTEFDKHIFKLGDSEQTDIMMRKSVS